VDAGKPAAYCRVGATVDGYGRIEVHLPVTGWTQRFLAGSLGAAAAQPAGFVTMSHNDLGHRGEEDAFATHYEDRVKFGYRVAHLQVLTAKALIQVFPYPHTQRYSGQGDVRDGANFTEGPSRPAPRSLFDWWGADFSRPGYEKWCTASGAQSLDCRDSPSVLERWRNSMLWVPRLVVVEETET